MIAKKTSRVLVVSGLCIICTIIALVLFLNGSGSSSGDNGVNGSGSSSDYSITEPYDYESIITSARWRGIPMRADRGAELAIPEDIYTDMTTEALLKSIISYPFLIDMVVFGSYRTGFLTLYQERGELYPEINELINRVDFPSTLIKEYTNMPVIHPEREYNIHLEHMEILIAQPEFTGGLSDSELQQIAEIAMQKQADKTAASDVYSNPKLFYRAVNENKSSALQSIFAALSNRE